MDDRRPSDREDESPRSAPTAPGNEPSSQNGLRDADEDDRLRADRSSSFKPALTEGERRQRWPVD